MIEELNPDRVHNDVTGLFYLAHYDENRPARLSSNWEMLVSGLIYRERCASPAVRRQFAGRGVSTKMLDWAVNHAASLGRSYLRLDCEADRQALRAIYERFGFRFHSYRDVGPYHLSRYEYVINAP